MSWSSRFRHFLFDLTARQGAVVVPAAVLGLLFAIAAVAHALRAPDAARPVQLEGLAASPEGRELLLHLDPAAAARLRAAIAASLHEPGAGRSGVR